MPGSSPPTELKPFQAIILVLSLLAVAVLTVEIFFAIPPEAQRVMRWTDNLICTLFLFDFSVRFNRAESKLTFMKWGWIELLASIPEIEALRWGRLFRVFRILRIILITRTLRQYLTEFFHNRTQGGVASVFLITFLVIFFSSLSILIAERSSGSMIVTAGDALWWSITTITTVGYGDMYPLTSAGRMIAGVLMITGVGLFGTISGVVASFFLGHEREQRKKEDMLMEHLHHLSTELAEFKAHRKQEPKDS